MEPSWFRCSAGLVPVLSEGREQCQIARYTAGLGRLGVVDMVGSQENIGTKLTTTKQQRTGIGHQGMVRVLSRQT